MTNRALGCLLTGGRHRAVPCCSWRECGCAREEPDGRGALAGPAINPKVLWPRTRGCYLIPQGSLLTITLDDTRLIARVPDQTTLELVPVSDSEFLVLEALERLTFEGDGTKAAHPQSGVAEAAGSMIGSACI